MNAHELEALGQRLKAQAGWLGKRDIQAPARVFPHQPFPELGPAATLGDDAALLPAATGPLLLACEGLHPQLVEEDPWFAGWCGVLVNLSDIAAMGGTPLAVVNSLWARDGDHAERLLAGMRSASETFAIPVVGGHTNLQSPYNALSVAVLGNSSERVLSARSAAPGDLCYLLVNIRGHFHRHYPFWDAATCGEPAVLRAHLALLAQLASAGIAHAAKDISMGGLIGTAVMFTEAAGCVLSLDLDAITPPEGVELEPWLTCFPSYGFLVAIRPSQITALLGAVAPHGDLLCRRIGAFSSGESELRLLQAGQCLPFWNGRDLLTGFGKIHSQADQP